MHCCLFRVSKKCFQNSKISKKPYTIHMTQDFNFFQSSKHTFTASSIVSAFRFTESISLAAERLVEQLKGNDIYRENNAEQDLPRLVVQCWQKGTRPRAVGHISGGPKGSNRTLAIESLRPCEFVSLVHSFYRRPRCSYLPAARSPITFPSLDQSEGTNYLREEKSIIFLDYKHFLS